LHAFARIVVPIDTSPSILLNFARSIARNVRFLSGHGGLVFVYHPWHKAVAFDHIYASARRFWCVDIEDLNASIPLMQAGIKGINWITMLGQIQNGTVGTEPTPLGLDSPSAGVLVHKERHGYVVNIGQEPTTGDINRLGPELDPYFELGGALAPLILTHHPDFEGASFVTAGNTVGWIRRFVNPPGWR
jgi:TseV toxin immunity protein TsiV